MSMLFLFEDEIIRYNFLDKEIIDQMDNRIAVEKTDKVFHLRYNKNELQMDAEYRKITVEEYLKRYVDSRNLRYICQEWQLLELDTDIQITTPLYKVQEDYIDMIDELDIFKQRDEIAYNLLSKKYDVRNLYTSNGCLYLGKRMKNEKDFRLLGYLAPGEMIMNKDEYNNFLQSIKDEVQTP